MGDRIGEKYFGDIFQMLQALSSRDKVKSAVAGLTVVKKIVDVYGSMIWVESKLGEGNTLNED